MVGRIALVALTAGLAVPARITPVASSDTILGALARLLIALALAATTIMPLLPATHRHACGTALGHDCTGYHPAGIHDRDDPAGTTEPCLTCILLSGCNNGLDIPDQAPPPRTTVNPSAVGTPSRDEVHPDGLHRPAFLGRGPPFLSVSC